MSFFQLISPQVFALAGDEAVTPPVIGTVRAVAKHAPAGSVLGFRRGVSVREPDSTASRVCPRPCALGETQTVPLSTFEVFFPQTTYFHWAKFVGITKTAENGPLHLY